MNYPEFCFRQALIACRYNHFACEKEVGLWLSRAIRGRFIDIDQFSDMGTAMVAIFGMPDSISSPYEVDRLLSNAWKKVFLGV